MTKVLGSAGAGSSLFSAPGSSSELAHRINQDSQGMASHIPPSQPSAPLALERVNIDLMAAALTASCPSTLPIILNSSLLLQIYGPKFLKVKIWDYFSHLI
jgi:hypothetical protein